MQPDTGFLIIIAAAVFSIAYALLLVKLDIIGIGRKREIKGTTEFVQFNLLRAGNNYAKMVQGVLHYDLFQRSDYVNLLRSLNYPIFVIFGPHLCWQTSTFMKTFKEMRNIRLYQFHEPEIAELPDDERIKITIKRSKHCLIVDGIHCFVEKPHPEHKPPEGGWECAGDIVQASKYEDIFDYLIGFCREIDRKHIIKSIGISNLYITVDGDYRQIVSLGRHRALVLLNKFAEEIGERDEIEGLWREYESQLQEDSGS